MVGFFKNRIGIRMREREKSIVRKRIGRYDLFWLVGEIMRDVQLI